jgi:starch-binding outer membrane protein, SusD/RagB family
MKNIIRFLFLIIIVFSIPSCVDLDLDPLDTYGSNIFDDENSTNLILNQAYSLLPGSGAGYGYYGRNLIFMADLSADDADYLMGESVFQERFELDDLNWTATNTHIRGLYPDIYRKITVCNSITDKVNQDDNPSAIGQALFLRSLGYFNLVRFYGGVPLITTQPETEEELAASEIQPRASINEIYDLIVADMENVVSNNLLPDKWPAMENGRATSGAAKTLLANIYLTLAGPGTEYNGKKENEWLARASQLLKEVRDSNVYQLEANYMTLWDPDLEYTNKETIFMAGNDGLLDGGSPGRYTTNYTPIDRAGWQYGWGNNIPAWDVFNSFDESDLRTKAYNTFFILGSERLDALSTADVKTDGSGNKYLQRTSAITSNVKDFYPGDTVSYEYWQTEGGLKHIARPHLGKFMKYGQNSDPFANVDDNSFIIYRYADVLLMLAEAEFDLNGSTADAVDAINQIRKRAYGSDGFAVTSVTRELIRDERKKELFQEAKRWFDIVRWDIFEDVLAAQGKNVKSTNRYFPIPQPEIDKNPALVQNPGY